MPSSWVAGIPLMARINFVDAHEMIDSRHSIPTTATFIRAGDGRRDHCGVTTDPAVDSSPTPGCSCRSTAPPSSLPRQGEGAVVRKSHQTANRSPIGSVSLGELISTTPQSPHQQHGSRRPAAAVGDSDPAIRRQYGDRRPVADDGKARGSRSVVG